MSEPQPSSGPPGPAIRVGIVMGSDSDWPVMVEAKRVCDQFGVGCEARVLSAHRTPDEALEWSRSALARGLRVLIAGAGGAAHLPGVLAATTLLPVIGVPIANGPLQGVDALLSIVQMPRGIPVATVGVGRADNAGLLAMHVLATADEELRGKLAAFRDAQRERVLAADAKLLREEP
jgi:5-(carboxyamino)imidazole ribonucleotide mutase